MTTIEKALRESKAALAALWGAKLADGTYADKDCKITMAVTNIDTALAALESAQGGEREAFERWVAGWGAMNDQHRYMAWEGWQARASLGVGEARQAQDAAEPIGTEEPDYLVPLAEFEAERQRHPFKRREPEWGEQPEWRSRGSCWYEQRGDYMGVFLLETHPTIKEPAPASGAPAESTTGKEPRADDLGLPTHASPSIIAALLASTPSPDAAPEPVQVSSGPPTSLEAAPGIQVAASITKAPHFREVCDAVNSTPLIQSLLYDLNLLPEQVDPSRWHYTMAAVWHMKRAAGDNAWSDPAAAEVPRDQQAPSASSGQDQPKADGATAQDAAQAQDAAPLSSRFISSGPDAGRVRKEGR